MKNSDLIGKKFGEWTLLKEVNNFKFLCRCSCGTEREVLKRSITSGGSKCCGKISKHKREIINKSNKKEKDIQISTGKILGNFKILKFKGIGEKYNRLWEIQCLLCNKIKIMKTADVSRQISCGCIKIKPKGESGFNALYAEYKRNAKTRELDFLLTKEEFKILTKQNCYYCGEEPNQIVCNKECPEHSTYTYNGVDRIDSTKGYIKDNCVPCCGVHNKMKRNMSYNEFIDNIKKIASHLKLVK